MEPIINTPRLVLARHLRMVLVSEAGPTQPIPAQLRYVASDPYAVALLLGDPARPTEWIFARELLQDGLGEPSGDGDVRVWPFPGESGKAVLLIELVSPDGEALLEADPAEVQSFLTLTHEFVAGGEESAYIDIDGLIGALLAA
jgi:hypothetical protein